MNSFFPSVVKLWNALPDDIKNIDTLPRFKAALRLRRNKPKVPKYFEEGERKINIIHTRLRNKCSELNDHLYRFNLVPSRSCRCAANREDNSHFLLQCPLFTESRNKLLMSIRNLVVNPSSDLLLSGSQDLTLAQNKMVFRTAGIFIKETKRFSS